MVLPQQEAAARQEEQSYTSAMSELQVRPGRAHLLRAALACLCRAS